MKQSIIATAVLAALPALYSCSSLNAAKPQQADLTIKPVMKVSHATGETGATYYQMGRALQEQGKLSQAAQEYKKALELDPSYTEARNALGVVYSLQGNHMQAVTEFEMALATAPQAAHIHNNLGYTYLLLQDYGTATAALEQAAALDRSNTKALNNLALAYEKSGNAAKARDALARIATMQAAAAVAQRQEPVAAATSPAAAPSPVAPQVKQSIEVKPAPIANSRSDISFDGPATVAMVYPSPEHGGGALLALRSDSMDAIALKKELAGMGMSEPVALAKAEPRVDSSAASAGTEVLSAAPIVPTSRAVVPVGTPTGAAANVVAAPTVEAAPTPVPQSSVVNAAITEAAAPVASPSVSMAVPAMSQAAATKTALRDDSMFVKLRPYQLHVVNANGVRGSARKASDFLRQKGVVAYWVGDMRPFAQTTRIEYYDGFLLEAARLRATLPNQPVIVKSTDKWRTADVKLVLGRDLANKMELFQLPLGNVALSTADPAKPL